MFQRRSLPHRNHRRKPHHPPCERLKSPLIPSRIMIRMHHPRAQRPRLRQRHPRPHPDRARFIRHRHHKLSIRHRSHQHQGARNKPTIRAGPYRSGTRCRRVIDVLFPKNLRIPRPLPPKQMRPRALPGNGHQASMRPPGNEFPGTVFECRALNLFRISGFGFRISFLSTFKHSPHAFPSQPIDRPISQPHAQNLFHDNAPERRSPPRALHGHVSTSPSTAARSVLPEKAQPTTALPPHKFQICSIPIPSVSIRSPRFRPALPPTATFSPPPATAVSAPRLPHPLPGTSSTPPPPRPHPPHPSDAAHKHSPGQSPAPPEQGGITPSSDRTKPAEAPRATRPCFYEIPWASRPCHKRPSPSPRRKTFLRLLSIPTKSHAPPPAQKFPPAPAHQFLKSQSETRAHPKPSARPRPAPATFHPDTKSLACRTPGDPSRAS